MARKWTIEIITAILLIVWIYTGISKLFEGFDFRYQISKQVFLKPFSTFLSYAVPILELAIAVALIFGKTRLWGLWASFILMTTFTLYVALVLSFSKSLPCTCGGIMAKLNWTQHLAINITLTVVALIGILLQKQLLRFQSTSQVLKST